MTSARNTWTIYTVDDRTGRVLTRIGGKQSTVAWVHTADRLAARPAHAARRRDHRVRQRRRAEGPRVLARDPQAPRPGARTRVTLLRQYSHSPPLTSNTQGNVQTLSGRERAARIGGGTGRLRRQARRTAALRRRAGRRSTLPIGPSASPGRASRCRRPTLALVRGKTGGWPVGFVSWNGATQVASWRLLAGLSSRAAHAGEDGRPGRVRDGDLAGRRRASFEVAGARSRRRSDRLLRAGPGGGDGAVGDAHRSFAPRRLRRG